MRTDPRGVRALAPFVALLTAVGLADSVTGSFMVLYFTGPARLTQLETGVATSIATLSGILLTTLAGRVVDRRVTRIPLLVALLGSAVGFVGLALVSGFVTVLFVVVLAGASAVGFPQVFALERASAVSTDGAAATGVLRAGWSLAWAVGPLIASLVVTVLGYRWLFVLGGALLLGAAILTGTLRLRGRDQAAAGSPGEAEAGVRSEPGTVAGGGADEVAPGASARPRGRPGVRLTIIAVGVFHQAMFAGSFALPLLITGPAHADPAWVGVTFGVCAAVEVPAAFLATRLLRRRRTSVLLTAAALLFATYFVVIAAIPAVGAIVGAQALRGVALAVMGVAGIEALRELMAPRLAAATAAFANALAVGSLLAGIGAGTAMQLTGAVATTLLAALLAAGSAALLGVAAWRRATVESDPRLAAASTNP